ncbi:hypothetical protein TorRG33x02_121460, partial [Trema orientale]
YAHVHYDNNQTPQSICSSVVKTLRRFWWALIV